MSAALYLKVAIASFDGDPADSDYQRGYLAALRDVQREAGVVDWEAGLTAFFDRDGALKFIADGIRTAGFPFIDGNPAKWSDWLALKIKKHAPAMSAGTAETPKSGSGAKPRQRGPRSGGAQS